MVRMGKAYTKQRVPMAEKKRNKVTYISMKLIELNYYKVKINHNHLIGIGVTFAFYHRLKRLVTVD